VCDFNSFPLVHIPVVKYFSRQRAVLTWHEVWGRDWSRYGRFGGIARWNERFIANLNWRKHVAVSDFTAARLNTVLNVPREKIEVVPNGVCSGFFNDQRKEKGKIVFVGRLTQEKHAHDLLIDGFVEARKIVPWLHLCIIGDGPLLPSIKEKARKIGGIQVYVDLSSEEITHHVTSSSIACFLSEYEGDGIAAKEALAAGCPVLTASFQLNAIAHNLVVDDFNGYIVEPESMSIAEGILKTFENWDKLHENCSKSVKNFSWYESVKQLERIYKEVVS